MSLVIRTTMQINKDSGTQTLNQNILKEIKMFPTAFINLFPRPIKLPSRMFQGKKRERRTGLFN